jgi:hypothetical protein
MLVGCNESIKLAAPDKTPTFGGIKWGSDMDDVKKSLRAHGFGIGGVTDYENTEFHGIFMSHETSGLVMYDEDGGATKIVVYITPKIKSGEFFAVYDNILDVMTAKYGKPKGSVHNAGDDGVGDLMKLLKLEMSRRKDDGLYEWRDYWQVDVRGGGVSMSIERDEIVIRYESIGFGELIDRINAKKDNAL